MDNSSDCLETSETSEAPAVPASTLQLCDSEALYFEIPKEQLSALCGVNDTNLRLMSQLFGHRVQCRGNQLRIQSSSRGIRALFQLFIAKVLSYMAQGIEVQADLLDALYCASSDEYSNENYRLAVDKALIVSKDSPENLSEAQQPNAFFNPRDTAITINDRKILPRNRRQHELLQQLRQNQVVFALGPAGTGKTFLAVAYGLSQLLEGQVNVLLLSRPVVEAGESLGFLPGDFGQKIGPYMLPLFDAIRYLLKPEQVAALEDKGMIEVAPLAYMRGRSLRDAIIILDEAQNATAQQVKMLLTRLGEGSQVILTGDPSQSDLGGQGAAKKSGLYQTSKILGQVEGVAVQHFRNEDIVRSALVRRIIGAYDSAEQDESQSRGEGQLQGEHQTAGRAAGKNTGKNSRNNSKSMHPKKGARNPYLRQYGKR